MGSFIGFRRLSLGLRVLGFGLLKFFKGRGCEPKLQNRSRA